MTKQAADTCAANSQSMCACHPHQVQPLLRACYILCGSCVKQVDSAMGLNATDHAGVHTEQHSRLQLCMEPHWGTFGSSATDATADLIRLAVWLGCRDEPQVLPCGPQAACLIRGAAAVVAAVETAGGVHALAKADREAAICLSLCMMDMFQGTRCQRLPTDVSCRVVGTFGPCWACRSCLQQLWSCARLRLLAPRSMPTRHRSRRSIARQ